MLDDPCTGTLSPYLQLVYGRRPEGVRRCQHDAFALALIVGTELADGGGLARTVDTYGQQHRRALSCHTGSIIFLTSSKNSRNLLLQERLQILRRIDFLLLDALPDSRHQLIGGLYSHISHDEGFLQLIQQVIIYISIADNQLLYLISEVFTGLIKALFQFVKKSHSELLYP